jgi:hypothetical protein
LNPCLGYAGVATTLRGLCQNDMQHTLSVFGEDLTLEGNCIIRIEELQEDFQPDCLGRYRENL